MFVLQRYIYIYKGLKRTAFFGSGGERSRSAGRCNREDVRLVQKVYYPLDPCMVYHKSSTKCINISYRDLMGHANILYGMSIWICDVYIYIFGYIWIKHPVKKEIVAKDSSGFVLVRIHAPSLNLDLVSSTTVAGWWLWDLVWFLVILRLQPTGHQDAWNRNCFFLHWDDLLLSHFELQIFGQSSP